MHRLLYYRITETTIWQPFILWPEQYCSQLKMPFFGIFRNYENKECYWPSGNTIEIRLFIAGHIWTMNLKNSCIRQLNLSITYMPKTENLFAKLPPQIAHILEYSTMLRYDLTSSMYSSYYYLPRDLNQGQVSKWYNPTVFAISITYTCCLPNPRPTAWCSSTLYSKLLSIST